MDEEPQDPVGFKKPPRHSQFKPGQSGNPTGRPKRDPNILAALEKDLLTVVTLKGKNEVKSRKMPKYQAAVNTLTTLAINGDVRALALLLKTAGSGGSSSTRKAAPIIDLMRDLHKRHDAADAALDRTNHNEDDDDKPEDDDDKQT
jgi:hypothetical protein